MLVTTGRLPPMTSAPGRHRAASVSDSYIGSMKRTTLGMVSATTLPTGPDVRDPNSESPTKKADASDRASLEGGTTGLGSGTIKCNASRPGFKGRTYLLCRLVRARWLLCHACAWPY